MIWLKRETTVDTKSVQRAIPRATPMGQGKAKAKAAMPGVLIVLEIAALGVQSESKPSEVQPDNHILS